VRKKLLLPHQNLFIQAPTIYPQLRYHFLVGGYGCGKTSSLASAWEKIMTDLQGKKDQEGHGPRVMLGGISLAHLEKTTLAYILEDLKNSNTPFTHDKKYNTLRVGNVTTLLVSLSSPQTITGFDPVAALCDEIDDLGFLAGDDVTFEAVKAVNERTRQKINGYRKPFIMFGSTSQGQKGLYRVVTQFNKAGTGYTLVRGRTKDNFYLDESYVESMYQMYNAKERKVFLEGEFLALAQGRVFGDFDWDRNYVDEDMDLTVGPDEELLWSQDINEGYHRGCVGVVRRNMLYVIKRYEFPNLREAPSVIRHDFPKNKIIWLPDASAKGQILQFTKELKKFNIWWVTRGKNPNVEDSAFLVNKMLYTRRLMVARAAKESAEAMAIAQRDKNNAIPKGIGQLSPIHDCDTIRMLCWFVACTKVQFLDIRRVTIQRHLEYEKEEEPSVKELDGGYAQINPGAL